MEILVDNMEDIRPPYEIPFFDVGAVKEDQIKKEPNCEEEQGVNMEEWPEAIITKEYINDNVVKEEPIVDISTCKTEVTCSSYVSEDFKTSNNMANFKYDLVTLLELIEQRPCLWSKKSEEYKNKIIREKSWEEIFRLIDDTYENKTTEEKKRTGEIIQQKWGNVRDAFIRSLKTKNGQAAKKRYLYAEHLQFLLTSNEHNDTDSNISQLNHSQEESVEPIEERLSTANARTIVQPMHFTNLPPTRRINRTKREPDDIEKDMLLELKKPKALNSSVPLSTSDEISAAQYKNGTFFASFLPYIEDMSEYERLDLHMEIIMAIKRIKKKRNNIVPSSSKSSPNTSSACDRDTDMQQQTPSVLIKEVKVLQPSQTYYTNGTVTTTVTNGTVTGSFSEENVESVLRRDFANED